MTFFKKLDTAYTQFLTLITGNKNHSQTKVQNTPVHPASTTRQVHVAQPMRRPVQNTPVRPASTTGIQVASAPAATKTVTVQTAGKKATGKGIIKQQFGIKINQESESNTNINTLNIYDVRGNLLVLGEKNEKASGGEGIVYTLPAYPNYLVKIYKKETLEKTEKMDEIRKRILAMTRMTELIHCNWLAWPCMPVLNKQKQVIGFVMRKCEGKSLQTFRGGPAYIRKNFPGWNRDDLARVAFDFVHKTRELADKGIYINDFNPANFLIDDWGNVSFIDCDSFQIQGEDGCVYITKTYFNSHVAPELLNDKMLLEKPRTMHHVEFGAALIAFNILMCGLHPYSYYDPQHQSACGVPDENLVEGRCPLGIGADCKFPPKNWYEMWSWLTSGVKGAFITTFRKEKGHGHPEMRTSLPKLEDAIVKLITTQKCDSNPERHALIPQTVKPQDYKGKKTENH